MTVTMKAIGKDGKVWRLSCESWDMLLPYDSDPNVAIAKMKAALNNPTTPCKFDAGVMVTVINDAIRTTLESFRE